MKSKILVIFLLISANCLAQYSTVTIQTPKGDNVTAGSFTGTDWEAQEKIDKKDYWLDYYDDRITYKGEATKKYNCHSYAWNIIEGGDTVWINTPEEDKYWNLQSYTEVSSQTNKSKVSFGGPCIYYSQEFQLSADWCDHSAVTTSQADYFISKWGSSCLFEHHKNDCPYDPQDLHFYKLGGPIISGSTNTLCDNVQRTFSESTFTNIDLEYDWDYTSQLDEISDDDENTYTVEGTSLSGQAEVSLTVTTPSGATATASKEMWVGTFESTFVTGQAAVCPDSYYTYTALVPGGHSSSYSYNWTYPSNWSVAYQNQNYIRLQTPRYNPDYGTVRVSITNDCGTSGYSGVTVYPDYCGMSYSIGLTPNPTNGETILTIESNSELEEMATKSVSTEPDFDENIEWELEIYSEMQMLKEKKTKLKGQSTIIQTQGWKEGVYIVRVKYKDEILTEKLVVKN